MNKKITVLALIISMVIISACSNQRGAYEAKTPCVFFQRDIQIIEPNPCSFRPANIV